MKWIRICLIALFAIIASVNYATAQEQTSQPSPPAATGDRERPKNEVEKAIEEARSRGETVLATCVEDCAEFDVENGERLDRGRVVELIKPEYPRLARAGKAQGQVRVQLLIDKEGKVVAASVLSGHPLLFATCLKAARETVFTPTRYDGIPVKVVGEILYNFIAQ